MGSNATEDFSTKYSQAITEALQNIMPQFYSNRQQLQQENTDYTQPIYAGAGAVGAQANKQFGDVAQGYGDIGKQFQDLFSGQAAQNKATGDTSAQDWQNQLAQISQQKGQQQQAWQGQNARTQGYTNTASQVYDVPRQTYQAQISDPSKRGYDPTTLAAMYSKASDVNAGQQKNYAREANKVAASQGMGGTGAVLRNLGSEAEKFDTNQLAANRDIGIAQGEAQRSDLQNALAGITGIGTAQNATAAQGLGLENQGLTAQNADVNNLQGLGVSAQNLGSQNQLAYQNLANQSLGLANQASNTGLAGQASAYGLQNQAQEQALGTQGNAVNLMQQNMNDILAQTEGEQGIYNSMIAAQQPALQADALTKTPGLGSSLLSSLLGSVFKGLFATGSSGGPIFGD